jgi:hypothetical protein
MRAPVRTGWRRNDERLGGAAPLFLFMWINSTTSTMIWPR